MANKKGKIVFIIIICIIIAAGIIFIFKSKKAPAVSKKIIYPHYGTIKTFVSTTGTILPQNRLEIKPPISGRVESILVKEGDHVNTGQTLIWMSSTDRAALIDAARSQGGSQLKYWEEVYKPIPLVAPITGTVIVRAVEPGQTATTATAILVLSDRLIIKANVDETDIGRVKKGQAAEITLDAYPEVKVDGRVALIKYESTTVNNVTTYEVQIVPDKVPPVYKSGMSANINIFDNIKKNVLLLADEAIIHNDRTYVLVSTDNNAQQTEKKEIKTGLSDEQNVEIVSGLTGKEKIVIIQKKLVSSEEKNTSSPFLPQRKK
ncbi:MAG: efflux RND transporter periplasmic adaptor subunit [Spirochaetota bacterium]